MKDKNNNNTTGVIIGIIVLIIALIIALWFVLKPVENSSNNNLDSLVIENYPITFSSDNTTYTINVDEDVNSIEVTAVPEDKNANVVITGNTNIQTGSNEIKITVTAADGTSKIYTVHVNKKTDNNDIIDDNNNNVLDNNTDNNANNNFDNNNNTTNTDNNTSNSVENRINSIIYE